MIGGLVDCVPGSLLAMGRHLSIQTSECGDGCVCPGLAWASLSSGGGSAGCWAVIESRLWLVLGWPAGSVACWL